MIYLNEGGIYWNNVKVIFCYVYNKCVDKEII